MIFFLLLGLFSCCTRNRIVRCVLTTSFVIDFIRRLVPLLQATWIQADVILDGRQTWTYYKHADPNNSDYAKWAEDYRERTNSTYTHTVSEAYFVTGMVVWMLTPILLALFALVDQKKPLVLFNAIFGSTCKIEINVNMYLKVILSIITMPIEIISAGIIIFVIILTDIMYVFFVL